MTSLAQRTKFVTRETTVDPFLRHPRDTHPTSACCREGHGPLLLRRIHLTDRPDAPLRPLQKKQTSIFWERAHYLNLREKSRRLVPANRDGERKYTRRARLSSQPTSLASLGRRVKVSGPVDKRHYVGVVTTFADDKSTVLYDAGGTSEVLDLSSADPEEKYEWLDVAGPDPEEEQIPVYTTMVSAPPAAATMAYASLPSRRSSPRASSPREPYDPSNIGKVAVIPPPPYHHHHTHTLSLTHTHSLSSSLLSCTLSLDLSTLTVAQPTNNLSGRLIFREQ